MSVSSFTLQDVYHSRKTSRFGCNIILAFALMTLATGACAEQRIQAGANDAPSTTRSDMSQGAADPSLQLQGRWRLTKIADVSAPDGALMTITANKVEIFLGCNTVSAVAIYGTSFSGFRDIVTTKMACEPDVQRLETRLLEALPRIGSLLVGAGDGLSFYDEMNGLQLGAVRAQP